MYIHIYIRYIQFILDKRNICVIIILRIFEEYMKFNFPYWSALLPHDSCLAAGCTAALQWGVLRLKIRFFIKIIKVYTYIYKYISLCIYVFTRIKNLFVIAALGAFPKRYPCCQVQASCSALSAPLPSPAVGQREGVKPSMWQIGQVGNKGPKGLSQQQLTPFAAFVCAQLALFVINIKR